MNATVVGRFAPTPSGPLHFGSVVAALGSYLSARKVGGRWLLRVDDLDPPRVVPGATDAILAGLDALGLGWDGPVVYQSQRGEAYLAALGDLRRQGLIYACRCSRRRLGGGPYPGHCRELALPDTGHALRVRVDGATVCLADAVQGDCGGPLAADCGDFTVRRADGVFAYHLACVVDDAWQGVTEVVRGADLLASTPRQVHLQELLGLPTPRYAHLPVVVDASGSKLSKQTRAPAVVPTQAAAALFAAADFLGLAPPAELRGAPPAELLAWALPRWSVDALDGRARAYTASSAANFAVSSA